jgi:hypothetical protein
MALTVYPDKLKSNMSSESNERRSYVAVACDNSYPTGGYSLDLRKYFSNYNFININVSNQQPYKGYWDQNTNKLLITYGDNTEVGNGTDLSSVYLLIESIDVPGIPSPTMIPTTPVQAGSGSGALIKEGATTKTGGTLTMAGGTSQEFESGSSLRINGASIAPTNITIAIGDTTPSVAGKNYFIVDGTITPSITNFHNGEAGQSIGIYCTAGTCVITHDITKISLKGKADVTMSAGDSISFMSIDAVWHETFSSIKNGSYVVAATGTQTIVGKVVETTGATLGAGPTPSVSGGTFFVLDGSVTGALTNFTGGAEGQVIALFCTVAGTTITHDNTKIDLAGNVNNVMRVGDRLTLKNFSGVWKQEVIYNKDGTTTVADGGTVTIASGGTVSNAGVDIKIPIIPPSSANLDASKSSYFTIAGATTPTVSDIVGGYANQVIAIIVASGSCTVVHNSNINLQKSISYVMQVGDSLTLQKLSGVWTEIGRASKTGKVLGDYEEQLFNATINMSPTASDIFHIAVTGDCTINMVTTVPGLTILLVLDNDATPRTVTFGTNMSTSGAITGQANKIASILLYSNGSIWRESSRKENLS